MPSTLKRPFSETSSENLSQRPTKLSRLSKTLANIWGLGENVVQKIRKSIQEKSNLKQHTQSLEPLSSSSRSNIIQSPIKASELAEYYEKVKQENSKLYSQLHGKTKDTIEENAGLSSDAKSNTINEFQPAESTQLDGSSISNVHSKTFDSALDSAKSQSENKAKSNSSAVIKASSRSHRLTFGIDPVERAQLIQLKRRMQADRYRRTREKYLRSHTQHLRHVTASSSDTPLVGAGANTKGKKSSLDQKLAGSVTETIDSIPKSKRNTRGIFTLQMAYNMPSDDESDGDSELALPQTKPVASKLKFPANGKKSKFNIGEKKKHALDLPESSKKIEEPKIKKHIVSPALKPTAAFSFGQHSNKSMPKVVPADSKKHHASIEDMPDSGHHSMPSVPTAKAFTFSATPGGKKSVPAFSFGKKAESGVDSSTAKQPAFSFTPSVKPLNDASKNKPSMPAFSFAPKKEQGKETKEKPSFTFGVKKEENSAPAFGAKKSTKQSDKHEEKKEGATSSAFKFGQAAASTTLPSKAAFSFNPSSQHEKKSEAGTTNELPKGPSKSDKSQPSSSSTTAFSFGNSGPSKVTDSKQPSTSPVPAFNFSSNAKSSAGLTAPAKFSFKPPNQNATGPASSSPAFSFNAKPQTAADGKASTSKPAFSFNSSVKPDSTKVETNANGFAEPQNRKRVHINTSNNASNPPVFNLDASKISSVASGGNVSDKPASGTGSKTPGFTFANPHASSGFGTATSSSFGASKPAVSAQSSFMPAAAKSNTGGGNINGASSNSKEPAFTFGTKPAANNDFTKNSSVPPSFGSSQNNAGSNSSSGFSSGFNFKQSSGFGAGGGFGQRASSNPPQSTTFGNSANGSSTVFGQNSKSGTGFGGFGTNAGNQPVPNAFGGSSNNNNSNSGNAFGGNGSNNNNSGSGMFNLNNNAFPSLPPSHIQQQQQPQQQQQQNNQNGFGGFSGQGFGSSQNNPNASFNFNMSSTPDFNFAGNNANKDPSAIFSGPPVQPMPRRARRKLAPRPLRRH
ncbi:hypothetical protein HII13_001726 [Brettanomyces bruxellensis]|nr:hypothetical protein HII13_001726 [Brettanomyces bruxellensis]